MVRMRIGRKRIVFRSNLRAAERAVLLALLSGLVAAVGVVYAHYSGPSRAYTYETCKDECVEWKCYYKGIQNDSGNYSCTVWILSDTKSCQASPGGNQWSVNRCGWPSGHGGVDKITSTWRACNKMKEVCTNESGTHPAATINASFNCTQGGDNGWCRGGKVNISASEPLVGEQITTVESDSGAVCQIQAPSGSCSWSPGEGPGSADFWAHSTWGDTTTKSSASWQIDGTPPQVDVSKAGPGGANGWVRGAQTYTCTGADALSGWSHCEVCIDGNCANGSNTAGGEGAHSVKITGYDLAGNKAASSASFKIDSIKPALSLNITGGRGGGYYGSAVMANASAGDEGSGVASVEVSLDGGAWQPAGASWSGLDSGAHVIRARAVDQAGNESSAQQKIQVDDIAPSSAIGSSPGCITGSVTLAGTAADGESGVRAATLRMGSYVNEKLALAGDGSWSYLLDPAGIPDGTYSLAVEAVDAAGNRGTSNAVTVQVDTQPPEIALPDYIAADTAGQLAASADAVQVELVFETFDDFGQAAYQKSEQFQQGEFPASISAAAFLGGDVKGPASVQLTATARDACGNARSITSILEIPAPRLLDLLPGFRPGEPQAEQAAQAAPGETDVGPGAAAAPPRGFSLWPLAALAAPLLLGATQLGDPRPAAWQAYARALAKYGNDE